MDNEMNWFDICKLIKSNDEFTIKFNNDTSGSSYYYGGLEITINIKNEKYTWCYDMFPLFENNWKTWDEAKEYFSLIITPYPDFSSYMNEYYNLSEDDELYQILKEKMLNANKYIVSQIENIAEHNNINLNKFIYDEEYADD